MRWARFDASDTAEPGAKCLWCGANLQSPIAKLHHAFARLWREAHIGRDALRYFCSIECGYQFALEVARKGLALQQHGRRLELVRIEASDEVMLRVVPDPEPVGKRTGYQAEHDNQMRGCKGRVDLLEGSNVVACDNPACGWQRVEGIEPRAPNSMANEVPCRRCHGKGRDPYAQPTSRCLKCGGTGVQGRECEDA